MSLTNDLDQLICSTFTTIEEDINLVFQMNVSDAEKLQIIKALSALAVHKLSAVMAASDALSHEYFDLRKQINDKEKFSYLGKRPLTD